MQCLSRAEKVTPNKNLALLICRILLAYLLSPLHLQPGMRVAGRRHVGRVKKIFDHCWSAIRTMDRPCLGMCGTICANVPVADRVPQRHVGNEGVKTPRGSTWCVSHMAGLLRGSTIDTNRSTGASNDVTVCQSAVDIALNRGKSSSSTMNADAVGERGPKKDANRMVRTFMK